MTPIKAILSSLSLAVVLSASPSAHANDLLKVAVGQRGNWDTVVPQLGADAGIFKKHGIDLEILYTQGGGETMQAVISNSVDLGVAAGTIGVLAAFQKGAPIRVVGAQATGAADFWYVRADSPLQAIKDATADTTIAYSTNGSSTNSIALAYKDAYGLKSKLVATGNPSATLTQVMSGQVDVGWSSPPFGFKQLKDGEIRIVARANDIPSIRDQSIRTLIANAALLQNKPEALQRFMDAYRETVDWMYRSDDALKAYAEFNGISEADARAIRDEFFPQALIDPDAIKGMDALISDGIQFKTLKEPLTQEQIDVLVQIPPRR